MFKETINFFDNTGYQVTFEISQPVKNIVVRFLDKQPTKIIESITIIFYFYP